MSRKSASRHSSGTVRLQHPPVSRVHAPQTGDVVHNIYIRNVERVNGELRNIEFATFEAVKNPALATQ